ncbi:cytidylyltransferase domain-containing protein [Sanyastnella coralliicola]|uniref:acylneuraminate cytidylyltransferase family protein n=1 Tax=Sanyastnella coralliicola TaxID=3069118 RepID=UPI0027B90A71|nr:NTP transferase domain-containing protein [Longitalea sp. SCSIO 12813]
MRTIAIIPARGGSKRLEKKNIYPLLGKPLIAYTIDALKECAFVDDIFVSSDDEEILKVGEQYGAKSLLRPKELADDHTPKIVAIRQAVEDPLVSADGEVENVIVAQANSPELTAAHFKSGYDLMVNHKLWEVMSADENGVQNAAFRIVKKHALFNEFLSAHCGFVVANNLDVHTIEDIQELENSDEFKALHTA